RSASSASQARTTRCRARASRATGSSAFGTSSSGSGAICRRRRSDAHGVGLDALRRRPQALLDVLDARGEHGDILPERRQIALEHLAPRPLVDQTALDAAERLRDRLVFLLEALQAAVDLVEVSEHFGPKRVELTLEGVEAPIHSVEAPIDHREPLIHPLEPLIDRVEALIDGRKALAEEPDEFGILGRGHARSVPQCAEAFKCVYS